MNAPMRMITCVSSGTRLSLFSPDRQRRTAARLVLCSFVNKWTVGVQSTWFWHGFSIIFKVGCGIMHFLLNTSSLKTYLRMCCCGGLRLWISSRKLQFYPIVPNYRLWLRIMHFALLFPFPVPSLPSRNLSYHPESTSSWHHGCAQTTFVCL